MPDICTESFHDSNFATFLHGHGDQRAHDSEGGDDDDEEEQKEHHVSLQPDCLEDLVIHIDPGPRDLRHIEEFFNFRFDLVDIVRILRFHRDPVKRIAQSVKLLPDEKGN